MPKRVTFTGYQERDIAARYRSGETCQAIARSLSVDFTIVRRVLVNAGVYEPRRRFQGRYSEADKMEMVRRYEQGESQRALGVAFGCHPGNVRNILLRRGVTLRSERTPARTSEQDSIIRQRRADGIAFSLIARELELPPHRVLTWAREMGISDFIGKTGPDSPSWKGGLTHHHGYVFERIPPDDPRIGMARGSRYVAQHRLVMARSLGRDLESGETVHHINGDRADNRLENLQLRQGQHGKGVRFVCRDCGSRNIEAARLE